jgi:hypothetical protein
MKQVKEFLSDVWDFTGIGAYFYGIYTVVISHIGNVEINNLLSSLSLLVGVIWVTLNVIDKLRNWRYNGPKERSKRDRNKRV